MRSPVRYTAREIKEWNCGAEYSPGRWTPARPVNLSGNFIERMLFAWWVFTGKMDVLDWEDWIDEARTALKHEP